MSSPIHSFLFSPPASPPLRAEDQKGNQDTTRAHGLTSLKSIFGSTEMNLMPRSSLDGNGELKIRSPRTPMQRHFTLDNNYPSPSRLTRPTVIVEDTDQTPTIPRIISPAHDEKVDIDMPINVPSTSIPMPAALPRPLIRLVLFASLIISSIMLLVYVPGARLPSLQAAASSRRLALTAEGKAYYDLANAVNVFGDGPDREYRPPQVRVAPVKRAALPPPSVNRNTAPLPKSTRTAVSSRPVPESHELLALQSYLLQSAYNVLPESVDPQQPLDAHTILNVGVNKLGAEGGEVEKAWLADLEREREDDIVVWYGADGTLQPPVALLDVLAALHGKKRKPTMIPVHGRQDLPTIRSIFDRMSIPIAHHPLVMIGNTPIIGDLEGVEELRGSGKLREMLNKIGWIQEEKKVARDKSQWKPKLAKMKKRELTEVEQALKRA